MTSVDTNVLLDVFGADATFGLRSKEALRSCMQDGPLVACEVVWAEIASVFPSQMAAQETMTSLGVEFAPFQLETALVAGTTWKTYRQKGGSRTRMVADFLIGAHALQQANRLLTRDRGFYRTYFSKLKVIDPTSL